MDHSLSTDTAGGTVFLRPRAFETIVYGALAVAILDLLFAFVFYGWILGVKYIRIFQSVAAGFLGRAAYDGGIRTFIFGLAIHFVVASGIAAVYYLASRKFPVLIRHAILSGLVYGLIAYLVMNYVVIPLSAIGLRPFNLRVFLPAFIAHAVLVGLPVALIARHSASQNEVRSIEA